MDRSVTQYQFGAGRVRTILHPLQHHSPVTTSVNRIFKAPEEAKDALGLEYHSVSQTTLGMFLPPSPFPPPFRAHTDCSIDQVFLTIGGR